LFKRVLCAAGLAGALLLAAPSASFADAGTMNRGCGNHAWHHDGWHHHHHHHHHHHDGNWNCGWNGGGNGGGGNGWM
jgi:Ni/Co efflux regulator RcnB